MRSNSKDLDDGLVDEGEERKERGEGEERQSVWGSMREKERERVGGRVVLRKDQFTKRITYNKR